MQPFKIRDPDNLEAEKEYHTVHLPKVKDKVVPHLWRFFAGDFFNNGRVCDINIDMASRQVELVIESCRITHRTLAGKKKVVPLRFRCQFREVVWQNWKSLPFDTFENDFYYGLSEINGETERLKTLDHNDEDRKPFCSLAMMNATHLRSLSLIFKHLRVEPLEPGAFALMQHHPDFHIPLEEA